MSNELFVFVLGLCSALLFNWSFRTLPREPWQIIGSVPVFKESADQWRGYNLTYYGLLIAAAVVAATALVFVLLGSIGIPAEMTAIVPGIVLSICVPAAKLLARAVEKKPHTLTVGGASFLGVIIAPGAIWINNIAAGPAFEITIPMIPALAAIATAYAIGEGLGRLACISFGCCYGKPLSECPSLIRRIFAGHAFVFMGKTKKIAYEGCMDGKEVIPIQGITSVFYVGMGLVSLLLFLNSAFSLALVVAMATTQGWRIVSETLRADYRGGGTLSAYQIMAACAVVFTMAFAVSVEPDPLTAVPDIRAGLAAIWQPALILGLQALGIGVFLMTGRSRVTGSLMSFHVLQDKI